MGMMEYYNKQEQFDNGRGGGGGGLCAAVKVMTDEQMELLRRQISVYATICQQLIQMHKAITAQQDFAGLRLGNLYCDPLMTYAGNKITSRQRWTPSSVQLQFLERVFDGDNGTPSKQKIKDITTELSQHGPISETNVYNWFQNRRARSKRKQLVSTPNNTESEAEAEVEAPEEKKMKPESVKSHENTKPGAENVYFQDYDSCAEMQCWDTLSSKGEPFFPSEHGLRSCDSLGHLALYEPAPRIEQLMGEMGFPESFSPYQEGEAYDIVG